MKPETVYFYRDEQFAVTATDVRTSRVYYPIANTVGLIRQDLLYASLALSVLLIAALAVYFDLWYEHEMAVIIAVIAVSLWIGFSVSILEIDCIGLPSRLFIAPRAKTQARFYAVVEARAHNPSAGGGMTPEHDTNTMEI